MATTSQVPEPVEVIRTLRRRALTSSADELGIPQSVETPRVWGVVMDTGYPQALVTLVTFADGSTSLYFGTGGGVIGAGQHQAVRQASAGLLAEAEAHLDELPVAEEWPYPSIGEVRFSVRTFSNTRSAAALETQLATRSHALWPLFWAAQNVITAVREQAERHEGSKDGA